MSCDQIPWGQATHGAGRRWVIPLACGHLDGLARSLGKVVKSGRATDANHANFQPCQSLFVAPCSHTWHYKCIRELLTGPSWPIFTCPNCRAAADLDADVDEPAEDWQQLDSGADEASESENPFADATPEATREGTQNDAEPMPTAPAPSESSDPDVDMADATVLLDSHATPAGRTPSANATSSPVGIPNASSRPHSGPASPRATRTPSPHGNGNVPHEGPLTPRNDAGPWVFDGDAGRASQDISRPGAMNSLDATASRAEANAA